MSLPDTESAPQHISTLLGINDCALAYARKWGVLNPDGSIRCIKCNYRLGTLPSLACEHCLLGFREVV